jgi:hypothetical protein
MALIQKFAEIIKFPVFPITTMDMPWLQLFPMPMGVISVANEIM